MGFTDQQALNKLASEGITIISKSIGTPVFTGSGTDDMSSGGEFTGDSDIEFEVEIDVTGTPDTFKWSSGVPGETLTEQATGLSIDGLDQALSDGVTIKFATTTGHTLADKWTFTARAADPTAFNKTVTVIKAVSLAPTLSVTSDVVDLAQIRNAALTIKGDFAAGAVLGMRVEIFTSPDNINWDTQAWADTGLEPTLVANTTQQKTSNLDTLPRYMRVKVTDLELGIGNLFVTLTAIEE